MMLPPPLTGIRVLDAGHHMAGGHTSMHLAQFGAEVIKVERPGGGDALRETSPRITNERGQTTAMNFLRINRHKKSIVIDLKKERGRDLFKELAKVSDIVWSNYTPGTMDKLGLGYEDLVAVNPRIIYAALSGFGHPDIYRSPYERRPMLDAVAQGMGGLMEITGQADGPPTRMGVPIGDIVSTLYTVIAILLALRTRDATGQPQRVDMAMYDCNVAVGERAVAVYSTTGQLIKRGVEEQSQPYGAFPAKDGWVVIHVSTDDIWPRFAEAIGRPDLANDPRMVKGADRAANFDDFLGPIIREWTGARTKAEITEMFARHNVPGGPIQTGKDLVEDPHLWGRKVLQEVVDPVAGKLVLVGHPVRLVDVELVEPAPAPQLGEHTEEVLTTLLGLSRDEVASLRAAKVVE
ncbi:MAG: CoA transferase [Chloroflexi bacterium]|nr:CoA transferase [Chloroflexota bacterium]